MVVYQGDFVQVCFVVCVVSGCGYNAVQGFELFKFCSKLGDKRFRLSTLGGWINDRERQPQEGGRGRTHCKTLARGSIQDGFRRISAGIVRLRASVLQCVRPLPLSLATVSRVPRPISAPRFDSPWVVSGNADPWR